MTPLNITESGWQLFLNHLCPLTFEKRSEFMTKRGFSLPLSLSSTTFEFAQGYYKCGNGIKYSMFVTLYVVNDVHCWICSRPISLHLLFSVQDTDEEDVSTVCVVERNCRIDLAGPPVSLSWPSQVPPPPKMVRMLVLNTCLHICCSLSCSNLLYVCFVVLIHACSHLFFVPHSVNCYISTYARYPLILLSFLSALIHFAILNLSLKYVEDFFCLLITTHNILYFF